MTATRVKYLAKYAEQAAAITAKYTDYKLGRNQLPRKAPARGASIKVGVASFDTRSFVKNNIVNMSGRARLAQTAAGATDALLNTDNTIPDTAAKVPGYVPAKVTIFIPEVAALAGETAPTQAPEDAASPSGTGAADDTTATPLSRVTGLEYRRRLGNSFTFPFGSSETAGQQSEQGMMNRLYTELGKGGKALSFKSEVVAKPTRR